MQTVAKMGMLVQSKVNFSTGSGIQYCTRLGCLGLLLAVHPVAAIVADAQTAPEGSALATSDDTHATKGYNPPFHPFAKHGANLWVRGDALYWRVSEDHLTYTYITDNIGVRTADFANIDFDWDWGFRVGAGYTIPHDRWDLALYWTRFHTSGHGRKKTHPGVTGLAYIWAPPTGISNIQFIEAHAHPRLDQLDFSLGREFFVSRMLTVRPNAGVRTCWIDQRFNIRAATPTGNAKIRMKNDFWGFGFSGGLDTKWMLASDWHLFASGAFSLLYGNFSISQKEKFNQTLLLDITESFHACKQVLDLQAGLEWAHLFCKQHFGITFRVGYEYHLYPDQNQLPLPTGPSGTTDSLTPIGGDLAYQGLFLSGQFDF